MNKTLKKIIISAIIVVLVLTTAFSAMVVYAWFSNMPRVYTSDQDSGQIVRLGMRINLLFERLRPKSADFPNGLEDGVNTINYGNGREVTYDKDAEWGTAENPYIISMSRHMINLYALQRAGYFYDRYVSHAGEAGDGDELQDYMPYFLVCDPEDGTPVTVDGNVNNNHIEIQPIGNDQYPFVGCIGGSQASGAATAPDGKTSISSVIANFDVIAKPGDVDVGLFGKIGYLGEESGNEGDSFDGAISCLDNLLLYDIKIVSKDTNIFEQIAGHVFANYGSSSSIEFEEDHHIGILAGHIEYASITNISVYYSSDDIVAIDVSDTGANYLSDSGIIGLVYNLNPEVNGNSIGSSSGNTITGVVAGPGQEWGGSIDMKTLHARLQSTLGEAKRLGSYTYIGSQTITIDKVNGNKIIVDGAPVTYTSPGDGAVIRTYSSELGGSFVFADDNTASESARYNLFHGKSLNFFPKTVTTITKENSFETGFVISNGANYLNAAYTTTSSVNTGTDSENATVWQLDNSGYLFAYIDTNPNSTITNRENDIVKYYLNASAAGELSLSTTWSTVWAKTEDQAHNGTLTYSSGGRTWYLRYNNGWQGYPFADSFSVANGNNYLGQGNGTGIVGTNADHAEWRLENGRLVTYYNGAFYYLNASNAGALSIGTTANSATSTWANNNGVLTCTVNGNTWYLRWTGSTWEMFPSVTSYTISSGTDYFGISGTDPILTNSAGAVRWVADGSKLYTPINGTYYYLVGSTDGSGELSLTTNRNDGTDWNYTISGGSMTYSGAGQTWYLYKQGTSWKVFPSASMFTLAQNGQYLRASSDAAVDGAAEQNASAWMTDSAGHIYTFRNGANRYLTSNGESVTLSSTASTVWTHNADNTVTNGDGWYLVYDNGWKAYPSLNYILIKDGDHYLTRSGNSGVADGNSTTGSRWFADGNKFYTLDGATKYYLRAASSGLSVTTTPASGTEFSYDTTNKRLSFTDGTTYYVIYNSGWTANSSYVKGVYITTSSGGTTYYLNGNATEVSTGTDSNTATGWTYNNNRFSTVIGSTTYYLRAALETNNKVSSTNLTMTDSLAQATQFTLTNENLTCSLNNTTYRLSLDGGVLKMVNTGHTYYTIHSGDNYLSLNGTTFQNSDQNDAVLWDFSTTANNTNTTVTSLYNGQLRYLYVVYSNREYRLDFSTNSQNWRWNNNQLQNRAYNPRYYLRYNNSTWSANTNATTLTRTQKSFTAAQITLPEAYYLTEESTVVASDTTRTQENALDYVSFVSQTVGYNQTITPKTEIVTHKFTPEQYQVTTKKVTTEPGGHDTFFPLVADSTAEFNVNPKNTGYIIGGSNNKTYQTEWGDVRISRYSMSSLSNSLYGRTGGTDRNPTFGSFGTYANHASSLEVLTRTYLSGGLKRISDEYNSENTSFASALTSYQKMTTDALGLKKYDSARSQLHDTFNSDPTNIFGMHFMDAVISTDHLITAPTVVINGVTYENYEMPEDSIDFRLRTKGYINFFAGSYYINGSDKNNSFFSLYQIFRVGNTISEIKRIEKIYGDPDSEKKSYIYKFENESEPSLPSGYVLMFDTNWIEHPTMVDYALYYFEVPVNAGEYALGSVEGGLGAYLCYLDIGTSAAEHSAVLGSIDFVYDNSPLNNGNKIVVVPDTSDNDTSLNYYTPSLTVLYTENSEEENGEKVKIDGFTVKVRRTIANASDSSATLSATFGGDDDEHIALIKQSGSGGDTIVSNTS